MSIYPRVHDIVQQLQPDLKAGNIERPLALLTSHMQAAGPNQFGMVLDLDFTNSPAEVAAVFQDFVATECKPDKLKLIYTEINGFTINPDCWFFNPFGFTDGAVIDTEDYGAFDFFSGSHDVVLTGMESLQHQYAAGWRGEQTSQSVEKQKFDYCHDLAALIVVSKFHKLMRASMEILRPRVPIIADGHDRGFAARVFG